MWLVSVLFKSCLQSQGHTLVSCGDWPAKKLGHAHEYNPTEHILQCNQSEPLENASRRIVDLMNENVIQHVHGKLSWSSLVIIYNMRTEVSEYPSHSFTYLPIYPHPHDIYYRQISEILFN